MDGKIESLLRARGPTHNVVRPIFPKIPMDLSSLDQLHLCGVPKRIMSQTFVELFQSVNMFPGIGAVFVDRPPGPFWESSDRIVFWSVKTEVVGNLFFHNDVLEEGGL